MAEKYAHTRDDPEGAALEEDAGDTGDAAFLDVEPEGIARSFAEDGPLASLFPDYEARGSQREMARCVALICNSGIHGVIEAPTGTGKSLAYLVPLLSWALLNKTRVLISTHTINLQHQLFEKDISLVRKILGVEFSSVLVKGRTNYVCCRRVRDAVNDTEGILFPRESAAELEGIAGWIENSMDGDRSELTGISDEVWESVASDADLCAGQRCPCLSECFFRKARRRAMDASVLVTNHALFFSDLGMRMERDGAGVLPPVDRIVLDEAHNIEDVATDCFGSELYPALIYKQLNRLASGKGERGGYLTQLEIALAALGERGIEFGYTLRAELAPLVSQAMKELEPAFTAMQNLLAQRSGAEGSLTFRVLKSDGGFLESMEALLAPLMLSLSLLARGLQNFKLRCDELPRERLGDEEGARFEILLQQLENFVQRIASFANFLLDFSLLEQEDTVYWMERRMYRKRPHLILHRSPLSIRRLMLSALHERYRGVCYTSATLANDEDDFSFFLDRIGLRELPANGYACWQLPTEFDYQSRVLLAVNKAFPERPDADFAYRFARFAKDFVESTQGRVFFLFTSWGLLRECYETTMDLLSEDLRSTCLRQGDLDRMRLLERFRTLPKAVLFGTSSFWEGVDVKGKGLIAVVIVRLPFQVPDDPLVKARTEAIEMEGRSSFMEYSLPSAVFRFRQGFGRLMRARDDYGAVVVLDPRMVTKSYGKVFFRALPPCGRSVGGDQQILGDVQNFLARYE